MMNVIALAFLLSYFGAVVVLVPEPHLTHSDLRSSESQMPSDVFGVATQSLQEPSPSAMDHVKGTLHQGVEKTAEGAQSAKDSIKGAYDQAKHGVQDKAEHAKEAVQDSAVQVKHGAEETAQQAKEGIQYRAGQMKDGVQATVGKATSHIPSAEQAKQAGSDMPSSYGGESMESLRRKLEDARRQLASYMQGKENDAGYLSFLNMRQTLDEASSYLPSKGSAAQYIPGKATIESLRKGAQETAEGVQERARDASESARRTATEATQGVQDKVRGVGEWGQEGEGGGRQKGKIGGALHGMKERLTGGARRRGVSGGQLEKKVQELCGLFDGGDQPREGLVRMPSLDVAVTRESYGYLMETALGSIEKAHELFRKETMGGERREQYAYLADSAKGSLEAAKEVFERAASAAEGRELDYAEVSSLGKTENMSKLKRAAIKTKERLSATLRPLMRSIYLATFSAMYGVTLWMTFVSGHLLARSLPRQQLGIVQSKIFPVYLRLLTGCVALCAVTFAVLHPFRSADRQECLQYMNLGVCIGLSLLNLLVVEPKATKMMFEKLKSDKEEGPGESGAEVNDEAAAKAHEEAVAKARTEQPIDTKFKELHQASSFLNLAIVAGLTWHLWFLANRLVV